MGLGFILWTEIMLNYAVFHNKVAQRAEEQGNVIILSGKV